MIYGGIFLVFVVVFLALVAERFVEPLLKERLHTLIVKGSDSLYHYSLGDLDASFLGGNVEVENLHISLDTNRYNKLAARNALPALTMELEMASGHIKGLAVFSLLFGKKVFLDEIMTRNADIKLLRHVKKEDSLERTEPFWKAIQPDIKKIDIKRINLDGVKLLYRNADTAESAKIQFDTCYAVFEDIRVDSLAYFDTSRIAFTKNISLKFRDLKYRSHDSTFKLKADQINYSSRDKSFEVIDFKMQPTWKEKEDFYRVVNSQQSMKVIEFERVLFSNFRMEKYFHNNIFVADSVLVEDPVIDIYTDKTYPPIIESKIGNYPHQHLLRAGSTIMIKGIRIVNAKLDYSEKGEKTSQEGKLTLDQMNITVSNVTNDSFLIRHNNKCIVKAEGKILGSSPIAANFTFYLDSSNGRFDMAGKISNVSATQLNALAVPLANTQLQSFNMRELDFFISGEDFGSAGRVGMLYDNLFVIFRKKDEATGVNETKKFLTKVINKYTLKDSNPGPDGVVRTSQNIKRARVSSQSFFALIWKTIFTGMQDVMMNSGRID